MNTTHNASSKGPSNQVLSELNLIRFSQGGDRDAFACLYETNLARIHRYIYFRVFDHELAEDITSLVFLKVWENLGSFQGGQIPFANWLYRIAHNTIIDYYRTQKTVIPLEDADPLRLSYSDGVDEKIDINTLSHKLVDALQELTQTQREVLILKYIWGLTTKEIARRVHKQQGAVRALQMRGLKRLAKDPGIHTQGISMIRGGTDYAG
jgi:RNA polymerase sigma-70 factor (ECF subfamily)